MTSYNTKGFKALELLNIIGNELSHEKICSLTEDQLLNYKKKYDNFINYNQMTLTSINAPKDLNKKKGDSLEELATYLLEISGGIFESYRNVKTGTNEIDQIFKLNTKGKTLVCNNIIDDRYECFLGECKNYDKKVSVTYVGKFCSLMLTNQIKLGIMFSYHGISGKNWNAGQGLIKKFYLHKENLKERYCIIDFNKEDFKSILNGDNFLNIVEKKMECLQFDTDYTRYLNDNGSK